MPIPECLETDRLVLRRHRTEDAPAIAGCVNNWSVAGWLAKVPFPYTVEHALDFIAMSVSAWRDGRSYDFLITLRSTGAVIGAVGLRIDPFGEARDREARDSGAGDRGAELGYWLAETEWGLGYGPEAAGAVVDFGFRDLLLDRIWATCLPDNLRSLALLERLGMKPEGTREYYFAARDESRTVVVRSVARVPEGATPP